MLLALVLALQAESVAPPSTAYRHIDFDLAGYGISEVDYGIGALRCRRDHDPQAITVCANRDGGAYPLRQMERRYGPEPMVADMRIAGNLRGGIYVEAVNLDPTHADTSKISHRVMVDLHLPF